MHSPDNPFIVIESKFTEAYTPGAEPGVVPMGSNNNEFIGGTQDDGSLIGIFRPNINTRGGSSTQRLFNVILGDPRVEAERSEFVVGGDETKPVAFEVLSRQPFRKRNLSESEMVELAKRIGRSSFY